VLPDEHVPRDLPAGLVRRQLPAGRYAVALHRGPYDTLDASYVALLGRWLPQRGVELADEPIFEIYLDDPTLTPPTELRTEICVRIA
jgi:AraC family transcriptional regulator